MHILLTRPLDDSKDLILRFTSLGHKVSHLPVIEIDTIKYNEPDYSQYKGIIFTSANAVKNLNLSKIDKKINCFCVGSSTEKVVKSNGFQNIFCADGNVKNLKEVISQNFDKKEGNLLYISGEVIASSLDKELISEGYSIKRIINYSANPIKEVKNDFIEKLKLEMPDIVYVYSHNSAISFLNLIKNHELTKYWMNTNLMCIGEKTSAVLNEIKWKKIFLFNPGEEEFLLYKI